MSQPPVSATETAQSRAGSTRGARSRVYGAIARFYDLLDLPFEYLREGPALQSGFQGLGHIGGGETISGRFAPADRDADLRDINLRFDLEIDHAGDLGHQLGDVLGTVAKLLNVLAKEFYGDLCSDTGHHVVQPVRDWLSDVDLNTGNLGDDVADFGHHLVA